MKSTWLIALLLCIGACGDSEESATDAATISDANGTTDAQRGPDASSLTDAGKSTPDAQSSDGGLADSGVVTELDAGSGVALGPVDCVANADCATSNCNQSPPGGICLGCAGDNCGSGFTCNFGACIRDCSDDGDCNIGKRCTNAGLCAIRTCSDITPCPAPYTCNLASSLCVRPACQAGQCPTGLSCDTGSNLCVEN